MTSWNVSKAFGSAVGSTSRITIPFERALLTYWRHFLRRSDQSASSSAARSTIRVRRGCMSWARRQPLAGERALDRLGVLDLGVHADDGGSGQPAARLRRGSERLDPCPMGRLVPLVGERTTRRVGKSPGHERDRPRQELGAEPVAWLAVEPDVRRRPAGRPLHAGPGGRLEIGRASDDSGRTRPTNPGSQPERSEGRITAGAT